MIKHFVGLVCTLTGAQMKARYRKTIAGFFWVIINPLLMFAVHAIIFKYILKINIPNYFLFLLGGLLPWVFITQTLGMTVNIFVTSRSLLQSFKVNPIVILTSQVLDNAFNFLVAFSLLLLILLTSYDYSALGIILLPIPIIIVVLELTVLCILLATIQVFLRDISYINNFLTSIMYFLTPIFYPPELIPHGFRWLIYLNPYYAFIEPFQICIWKFEIHAFFVSILRSLAFLLITAMISVYYWRKKNHEFYSHL